MLLFAQDIHTKLSYLTILSDGPKQSIHDTFFFLLSVQLIKPDFGYPALVTFLFPNFSAPTAVALSTLPRSSWANKLIPARPDHLYEKKTTVLFIVEIFNNVYFLIINWVHFFVFLGPSPTPLLSTHRDGWISPNSSHLCIIFDDFLMKTKHVCRVFFWTTKKSHIFLFNFPSLSSAHTLVSGRRVQTKSRFSSCECA